MRLLAVDTATTTCRVALIDGASVLADVDRSAGGSHARHLMGMIAGVLGDAGMAPGDLDGFGVCRGPGSFTGLRIGIGAVKGLAYATGKPVAGVSRLEALAAQSRIEGRVCALMDARRGEAYRCLYRVEDGWPQPLGPERVSPIASALNGIRGPCRIVSSGIPGLCDAVDKLPVGVRFARGSEEPLRASTVARLAVRRIQQEGGDDPFRFVPAYIRLSDAERNRRKTHSGN